MLASEDMIQREFVVFSNVADNFPKYVVSLDEFDMSRDGIKHWNKFIKFIYKSEPRRIGGTKIFHCQHDLI